MKTTLAILGIFAAAVLATSFTVSAYALSQSNSQTQAGAQSSSQTTSGTQAGLINKQTNYNDQDIYQKAFSFNKAKCSFAVC
jgi:hypothetical protein